MASKHLNKIRSYFGRGYCSKKEEDSSSIWSYFRSNRTQEKPPAEECRKTKVYREDPDLSRFGGQAYRTCGSAYVVQKDTLPENASRLTDEAEILARIEADPSNKGNVCDPMPPFRSVEQRLIDLTEKKLHPFYKKFMSLPKRDFEGEPSPESPFPPYKCASGPIEADEIPDVLNFNGQLLEKKNIYADFKRVELPQQMLVRIVEMERNKRPTLEKKDLEKKDR